MTLCDYEKKHLALLRPHLAECAVLLKYSGDFPLESPCRIAAYGSGVRQTVKGGTGSGEVNSRYFVTVEQGLTEAGFTVTTGAWLDAYDALYHARRKTFFRDLRRQARKAGTNPILYGMGRIMPEPDYRLPLDGDGDAAIYVLRRISGEGNDREPVPGDILLSETEIRDILALNRRYRKFMLVLNVGGPVDLRPVAEVSNILLLSQLGVDTGSALADILLGKQTPSGKLATTWSSWEDYSHLGQFGQHDDTRYQEGIFVGYRYFDAVKKQPMYPFGFGLSYTTFEAGIPEVTLEDTRVRVTVCVTNTGRLPGKEVVQVYVCSPAGKLIKPPQALAGFAKTQTLLPGETQQLQILFDMAELVSYDEDSAAYILEKGRYPVRVGNSSRDTVVAAVIDLDRTVTVTRSRNVCGTPDFAPWQPQACPEAELGTDTACLMLSGDAFSTTQVVYEQPAPIDDAVKALTDRQLAYLNIGAFDPRGGLLSIIGNASTHIAGAAGETPCALPDFPAAVMADGPAGLRLSRRFYRDKKGIHIIGEGGLPETVLELLPGPVRFVAGKLGGRSRAPKGAREETQYCTALPIGTALAQSWNLEFAEICGHIVGSEMTRFGVSFWLAPALNIHRDIRCGRNFEYYSEDPLISGLMAAAVTGGVQAHPGCAVTLKHFCANNQEYNRSGSNSMVSERAMREIYLRGFGICVRRARPYAVMTSYNLLNGIHTAESRGLCQHILRDEFGFTGIVMTDWVVGGGFMASKRNRHPSVRPRKVARAGGDLFMPGSKADYKDLCKGLAAGELSREQLQINASRLSRTLYFLGKK